MHTLSELIADFTDDDLDFLQQRLDERANYKEMEHNAEIVRRSEEAEAEKHCDKCETYMSCRERRVNKCDRCGHKQERY